MLVILAIRIDLRQKSPLSGLYCREGSEPSYGPSAYSDSAIGPQVTEVR